MLEADSARAEIGHAMKPEIKDFLKNFCIELALYGTLVVGYFFLVLHLIGDWLYRLFLENRTGYATVALGLIIGQGLLLEALTTALLRYVRAGRGR
jgi:hypothetical protein